ncbi:hypothetical protein R5W24_003349 [Gemmata sp. JC717]|uniref:hypothetical protein n=1 Tax=Gemmata algarum TaxID=2975278 RepID=UPI0021BAD6DD|nr:hypothetical protein [Gemmata algarum]MDY3554230.1 hypothetical protein [Gemmata algarum]
MTEQEWLATTDPTPMVAFVMSKVSDRKLRLLAVACCNRIRSLLVDPRSLEAVSFSERHADTGPAKKRGHPTIRKATTDVVREVQDERRRGCQREDIPSLSARLHAAYAVTALTVPVQIGAVLFNTARAAGWSAVIDPYRSDPSDGSEMEVQAALLREVFGPLPFRSVTVEPAWLTSDVVLLAEGIYQERAFDRMPILADALQDAGCDNKDVLNHCRQPGEHVRGCWVLDLITGRK